jgi:hypothetical protein
MGPPPDLSRPGFSLGRLAKAADAAFVDVRRGVVRGTPPNGDVAERLKAAVC